LYGRSLERKASLEAKAQGLLAFAALELAVAALVLPSCEASTSWVGPVCAWLQRGCVALSIAEGAAALAALRVRKWAIVGVSNANESMAEGASTPDGGDLGLRDLWAWAAKLNEFNGQIVANWVESSIEHAVLTSGVLSVSVLAWAFL
jgi:hypothetical protein